MKILFRLYILLCLIAPVMIAQPTLTIKRARVANWPTVEVFYEIKCIGQLNTTHTTADLLLSENGIPIPAFTVFSPDTTQPHPMSVSLVFDASDAGGGTYNPAMKRAGTVFIDKMNGSSDEAALIFFNTIVTLQQSMTNAQATLRNQLTTLGFVGDRKLIDGMHAGITHVASGGQQPNKAMVVASVGYDNLSTHTMQEVIDLARDNTVRVYTIGIGGSFDTGTLRTVADSTGGVFYSVSDTAQLIHVYSEIYEHINDLGRESRLTFPTECKDGALHQFTMSVPNLCTGSDSAATNFRKPDDPSQRTMLDLQIIDAEAMAGSFINVPIAVLNFPNGTLQPCEIGFSFPKSSLELQEVAVGGSSPLLNIPVDVVPVGDNYIIRTHKAAVITQPGVILALKFFVRDTEDSVSCEITPRSAYAPSGCLIPVLHAGRVNIAIPPRPVIESVGANGVCPGDSVVLRLTKTYDRYTWTTGDTSRTIVVRTGGNVGVAVMDRAGRTALSSPFSVQVFDAPAPKLNASGVISLCSGRTLPLNTTAAFAKYLWSTGDTTSTLTVDSAGTYFVEVTDNNGCKGKSDTVIVTLDDPRVTISADGPLTLCEGDTVRLRASDGFSSWRWSNGGVFQEIPITATGRYSVRVINAAGCETASDTIDVVVLPRPTAVITSNRAFILCPEDSLVLDAQDGFLQYRWSTGASTRRIVVRTPGEYSVRVAGVNGCFSNPVSVRIDAAVRPSLSPSGAQVACYGEAVRVEATPGFVSYRWNTGDTTRAVDLVLTGDYWVNATDAGGCVLRSDTVTVQLRNRIEPDITIEGSLNLCEGDSVMLLAPIGYLSYYWSTGETSSRIAVRRNGEYHVTVYDSYNCSGRSREVSVSLRPRPDKPSIIRQDAELIAPLAAGYQWYRNGLPIPNATARNYIVLTNGWYAVEVFNEYSCGTRSDEMQVLVTSVETLADGIDIAVFPEPNDGIVNVTMDAAHAPLRLRVMNLLGQTVATFASDGAGPLRHRFDLSAQPAGMYLLRVDAGGEVLLRRFVKLPTR